jgi:hypothetical protein
MKEREGTPGRYAANPLKPTASVKQLRREHQDAVGVWRPSKARSVIDSGGVRKQPSQEKPAR